MWNSKKSVLLSKACVILFIAALAAAAVSAPFVAGRIQQITRAYMSGRFALFLATCYTGVIPAAALLATLYALLCRLERGSVFVRENVTALRLISWYCFAGALICAVSALYYFPWLLIAAAAGFMGMIVRVVKNVFARAVSLQEDADYTI